MADENLPYTWRCRIKDAGTGTLGDLAVYLVSVAHMLRGLEGRETLYPDINDALHIERIIHGIIASSEQGKWLHP